MNSETWCKVTSLFDSARGIANPEARNAFVHSACQGDEDIQREVESLLLHDSKGGFLGVRSSFDGKRLGHYRIIERLGEGGMGLVYKAEDTRLQRLVAIKVLPAWIMASPEARASFRTEAICASAITHANIVTVHGLESLNGVDFMIMEYVEGRKLEEVVRPHGIPVPQAIAYARQLASAIARLHAAGVVHGDLSPANIMVTGDYTLKLLDFGLARWREISDEHPVIASRNGVFGTRNYMAPERASGIRNDHRSDIFSFGVILYEMLTGERPFSGASAADVLGAISSDSAKPLPRGIPEPLGIIIRRALNKDVEARFQSAEEILDILESSQEIGSPMTRPNPEETTTGSTGDFQHVDGHGAGRRPRVAVPRRVHILLGTACLAVIATAITVQFVYSKPEVPRTKVTLAASAADTVTYNRAAQLMRARRYTEAKALFDEVLNANPSDMRAMYNRAVCLQNLNRWKEAVSDFTTVLEHDASDVNALYNRAMCYMNQEMAREALDDLSEVIRLRPTRSAYENRAKVRALLGDDAGAKDDSRRASQHEGR